MTTDFDTTPVFLFTLKFLCLLYRQSSSSSSAVIPIVPLLPVCGDQHKCFHFLFGFASFVSSVKLKICSLSKPCLFEACSRVDVIIGFVTSSVKGV